MPRVQAIWEYGLAESALQVAESRTLAGLGAACRRAIRQITGYSTFGLYWLDGGAPHLFASGGVPDGFDEDYRTGLAKSDPFIDSVLCDGRVVDGLSLIGPRHWTRSIAYDLLRTWGLRYNMCGPLRFDGRVVGVFYTGTPAWGAPYTPEHRGRMEVICRAGSLALTNLIEAGVLHERSGIGAAAGFPAPPVAPPGDAPLPPRAAEVAQMLCRGRSNKEIARHMGISDETVKDHVASLCRRFGALNRTELAARLQRVLSRP
jgi:DNA-binding CsgD family transcriptional regulator